METIVKLRTADMFIKSSLGIALAVIGLAAATPVSASVLTEELNCTVGSYAPPKPLTVEVPQFDTSKGTLKSMTLTWQGNSITPNTKTSLAAPWSYMGFITIEKYGLANLWNLAGATLVPQRDAIIPLPSSVPPSETVTLYWKSMKPFQGAQNVRMHVIYAFAPVPEPSTLLAGALLFLPVGLGLLRNFRRKT